MKPPEVALVEKTDFGMSMVVAPAYLLHLKISEYLPFYTFGMSEYVLQIFVLIALVLIMRKFKKGYLFSFITAVFYGFVLDGSMILLSYLIPVALLTVMGIETRKGAVVLVTISGTLVSTKRYRPRGRSSAALWP